MLGLPGKIQNKFLSLSLSYRIAICTVIASGILFWLSSYFLYCNDAYIRTNLVPIVPKIQGYITQIYVQNNQYVKAGDRLIEIDPTPYKLAVDSIQAQVDEAYIVLDSATQGKRGAVDSQEAIDSQVTLAKDTLKRYSQLEAGNFVSKEEIETLTSKAQTLKDQEEKAEIGVIESTIAIKKQKANIKVLETNLATAKYELSLTMLIAPIDGYINNLEISIGQYVNIGEEIFGLVDHSKWRVIANYQQAELAHINTGDTVFLYIPNFPWKVWTGKVVATGHGVARSPTPDNKALPYIEPITDWIRYPYRFPVYIEFNELPQADKLYMGMDIYSLIIP